MNCDCPECRELTDELRANTEVLRSLRDEPWPGWQRKPAAWRTAALAAALVIALMIPVPKEKSAAPRTPAVAQPLRIKMLTPDPDVVIYWLIDPKESNSQ